MWDAQVVKHAEVNQGRCKHAEDVAKHAEDVAKHAEDGQGRCLNAQHVAKHALGTHKANGL